MNHAIPATKHAGGLTLLALLIATGLCPAPASGQASAATASSQPAVASLETLVAPIALYPDDLVAIVLPAATNPLQLVQAERFLEKRRTEPNLAVDEKWDDAVKALLNYPEIVKTMSGDLDWTSALGEAVVKDSGEVLAAIQAFRRKVQAAGNLKTDAKQVIVVEKEVVKIVPADPQVIYVPQYNPTTVVVVGSYSAWGYWPTPYPVYYYPYPPGAAFATGVIWGAAIGSAWHGGHYEAHYGGYGGNNNININTGNINVNTGNVNRGAAGQRPASGKTAWQSNKKPGQVSRTVGRSAPATARVGDARAGTTGAAGTSLPTEVSAGAARPAQASRGLAARPTSVPSSAVKPASGTRAAPSAFEGYGSGRQTQLDSSRGAASRGVMASGGGGGGRGGRR